jgi:hypothetical protein
MWSSRTSAGVVAGIAAVASYSHMRGLALRYGQESLIANLLPLSVDGLVICAAVAIGDGRRNTWSAWVSFWVGVGASIVANVLAARPELIARAISAWPAVALLLVVEVLSRSGRADRNQAVAETTPVPDDVPAVATAEPGPVATIRLPAEPGPVATTPPSAEPSPDQPAEPAGAPDVATAASKRARNLPASERISRVRLRHPDAPQDDVARRARVSVRTVQRHWPATTPNPPVERVNGAEVAALSAPDLTGPTDSPGFTDPTV